MSTPAKEKNIIVKCPDVLTGLDIPMTGAIIRMIPRSGLTEESKDLVKVHHYTSPDADTIDANAPSIPRDLEIVVSVVGALDEDVRKETVADYTFLTIADSAEDYFAMISGEKVVSFDTKTGDVTTEYPILTNKSFYFTESKKLGLAAVGRRQPLPQLDEIIGDIEASPEFDVIKASKGYEGEPLTVGQFYQHRKKPTLAINKDRTMFVAFIPLEDRYLSLTIKVVDEDLYDVVLETSIDADLRNRLTEDADPVKMWLLLTAQEADVK